MKLGIDNYGLYICRDGSNSKIIFQVKRIEGRFYICETLIDERLSRDSRHTVYFPVKIGKKLRKLSEDEALTYLI